MSVGTAKQLSSKLRMVALLIAPILSKALADVWMASNASDLNLGLVAVLTAGLIAGLVIGLVAMVCLHKTLIVCQLHGAALAHHHFTSNSSTLTSLPSMYSLKL